MNPSVRDSRTLRRWALITVAANVAVVLVAGLALPAAALPLLPVLGLTLPLLTTAVFEAAVEQRSRAAAKRPHDDERHSGLIGRPGCEAA